MQTNNNKIKIGNTTLFSIYKFPIIALILEYLFIMFVLIKTFVSNEKNCGTGIVALAILSLTVSIILISIFLYRGFMRKQIKNYLIFMILAIIPSIILLWFSGLIP